PDPENRPRREQARMKVFREILDILDMLPWSTVELRHCTVKLFTGEVLWENGERRRLSWTLARLLLQLFLAKDKGLSLEQITEHFREADLVTASAEDDLKHGPLACLYVRLHLVLRVGLTEAGDSAAELVDGQAPWRDKEERFVRVRADPVPLADEGEERVNAVV